MTLGRFEEMYCFNYRGVAVHTTLYNLFEDTDTLDTIISLAFNEYLSHGEENLPISMIISQENDNYLVKIA